MRAILGAILMTVVFTVGCSSAQPRTTDYQAATCIPPVRPSASASPASPNQYKVAVIGDSFTGGSNEGGYGTNNWTRLVAERLRLRGIDIAVDVGAEGGSGYVQGGAQKGRVFGDQVEEVVKPDDDLVVFFGSVNDRKMSIGQVAYEACETFRNALLAAPHARLLVIGPPWVNDEPPEGLPRIRDVLRERTDTLGGQFLDPLEQRWFNDKPELIGEDGMHPTNAGHEFMAERIAPYLEEELGAPASH